MSYILKTVLHDAEFYLKELHLKKDKGWVFFLTQHRKEAVQFKESIKDRADMNTVVTMLKDILTLEPVGYMKPPRGKINTEQLTDSKN